jgi:hypothetical protein
MDLEQITKLGADVCRMTTTQGASKLASKLAAAAIEAQQQVDWVKNILAEMRGYDGPLYGTACSLREWLGDLHPCNVPSDFVEYCLDFEDGERLFYYDKEIALTAMRKAMEQEDKFTFSTDAFTFINQWNYALSAIKDGRTPSREAHHALMIGVAAGMKVTL